MKNRPSTYDDQPSNARIADDFKVRGMLSWRYQTVEKPQHQPSPLAKLIVRKYSWGDYSAPDVQETALAAVASGVKCNVLERFAAMGASGAAPTISTNN